MSLLGEFQLVRPWWLLALLPLAWVWWRQLRPRPSGSAWEAVCDLVLLRRLLVVSGAPRRRLLSLLALAVIGLLAVLTLAGPARDRLELPLFRDPTALVIVLDLSASMNATDLVPNRLQRARFKISDILNRRATGQTALLVYAGRPFLVSPVTDDVATIRSQLHSLDPGIMPAGGSRADLALAEAARLLQQAGHRRGDILLLSDGLQRPQLALQQARLLREQGYRTSVLGVGTVAGAPVPAADGFAKDATGAIVISKLDREALRTLARAGGGIYKNLGRARDDVEALLAFLAAAEAGGRLGPGQQAAGWRELGPWLLLPLLPLAAFGFRRGYLLVPLAVLGVAWPHAARAWSWSELWTRPDQQAQRLYQQGKMEEAAERFRAPLWQATAWYRAGRYEDARTAADAIEHAAHVVPDRGREGQVAVIGTRQGAIPSQFEVVGADHRSARYDRRSHESVLELANVARPVVGLQKRDRAVGYAAHVTARLFADAAEKRVGEQLDVFQAVPERRHLHLDDLEPEVQVFPEAALGDEVLDGLMRGGDHPRFGRARLLASHRIEASFL